MVGKYRRFKTKGLIEKKLNRRIGEVVFSADDMGNLHEVIIYDGGKVIRRNAIRTDYNKITDRITLKFHLSPNEIVKFNRPFVHTETKGGFPAALSSASRSLSVSFLHFPMYLGIILMERSEARSASNSSSVQ